MLGVFEKSGSLSLGGGGNGAAAAAAAALKDGLGANGWGRSGKPGVLMWWGGVGQRLSTSQSHTPFPQTNLKEMM